VDNSRIEFQENIALTWLRIGVSLRTQW